MRIARIEDLHCDAGWRHFSFLKITTDSGLVGWSEYQERFGTAGLTGTIHGLGDLLIGRDPRPVEAITAWLHGVIRQVPGGIAQQAIAAIENALVDIKAKSSASPSTTCSAARSAPASRSIGPIAAMPASAGPTGFRNGPAGHRSAPAATSSATPGRSPPRGSRA